MCGADGSEIGETLRQNRFLPLPFPDPDKLIEEFPPEFRTTFNVVWEQMQDELAHLSTEGKQKIAKNSSHYINSIAQSW